jgi:hypothetical protein
MIEIKTKLRPIIPFSITMRGEVSLSNGDAYSVIANSSDLEFEITGAGNHILFKETALNTDPKSIREYEALRENEVILRISSCIGRDLFCLPNSSWIPVPNIFSPASEVIGLRINRFGLIVGGNLSAKCKNHDNIVQCILLVVYIWLRRLHQD